jgi:hypothetical protein
MSTAPVGNQVDDQSAMVTAIEKNAQVDLDGLSTMWRRT